MKITILLAGLLFISMLFLKGTWFKQDIGEDRLQTGVFTYPATVKAVIDKKCYGCHSVQGKSDDAKKHLMWDSIPNLDKAKLVGKLGDIIDVLDQGTMPPKKVVEKYPEAKLLPEESDILKNWANAAADSLMN